MECVEVRPDNRCFRACSFSPLVSLWNNPEDQKLVPVHGHENWYPIAVQDADIHSTIGIAVDSYRELWW